MDNETTPRLVWIYGRPMVVGGPEGHCPHGEALCDDKCEDYSGCILERERNPS